MLMNMKQENDALITILDKKIGKFDEEIESIKKDIKVKSGSTVKPKLESIENSLKCNKCEETFNRFSDLEHHIKISHVNHQHFQCDMCEKSFVLNWRLQKHLTLHNDKNISPCHYFNNDKIGPFEDLECKFLHIASQLCNFDKLCKQNKCPFRHMKDVHEHDTNNGGQ